MFRDFSFGLCVAALLVMPSVVSAESMPWLVDTNTSAVIFDDNFEAPLEVPGSLPVATTGSWTNVHVDGGWARVANVTTAGFAANEGSQFMDVYRGGGAAWLQGQGDATKSGNGHTIRLQMAFRSTGEFAGTMWFLTGGNDNTGMMLGAGGVVKPWAAGWGDPLTQTYSPGEWNTLTVMHVNDGGSAYMVSINGQTAETLTANAAGLGNFNGVEIDASSNGNHFYVDSMSVPEPSACALLTTGLLGLLAYAWRKRR